jgi:hypothetical protein
MLGRSLCYVTVIFLLSGCFLKNDAAAPNGGARHPAPQGTGAQGSVTMEELIGEKPLALIQGRFTPKSDKASLSRFLTTETEYGTLGMPMQQPLRGPTCKVSHLPSTREAKPSKLISVGDLSFAPMSDTNFIPITQDQDNLYLRQLDSGLPPGMYSVKWTGSEAAPAVGISNAISLPDPLVQVQINGSRIEAGIPQINKTQPLHVAWKAPVFPNKASIMIVDVYADSANETIQVHCSGMETDFVPAAGTITWEIPASYLADFPSTNEGQIYFLRGHGRELQKPNLDVMFQGIRAYFSTVSIQ